MQKKIEIREQCKGVYCVDLGESFPTHIWLQRSASIQLRTSLVKFARSPCTDPPGFLKRSILKKNSAAFWRTFLDWRSHFFFRSTFNKNSWWLGSQTSDTKLWKCLGAWFLDLELALFRTGRIGRCSGARKFTFRPDYGLTTWRTGRQNASVLGLECGAN